ncbi:MAG: hypothetical protein J5621_01450 [Paludibacteraceae bacterium]|nr:hypothetical protein [Paludibacteraceae bacterium]
MKKIFSFLLVLFSAITMMAQDFKGGTIRIPNPVNATVTVTRGGAELQSFDSVYVGDLLNIKYSATYPWFIVGDSIVDITLDANDFTIEAEAYYTVQSPIVNRFYSLSIPKVTEPVTLTLLLNGDTITSNEDVLIGDTLVTIWQSTDEAHWFFEGGRETTHIDSIVLQGSDFSSGLYYVPSPAMYELKDYYVNVVPTDHVSTFASINGDTISGLRNIVHFGDSLHVTFIAEKGWRLCINNDSIFSEDLILNEMHFNADSIFEVYASCVDMQMPTITEIKTIDSTTTLIKWEGDHDNYEIRVSTVDPYYTSERYWKGIRAIQGHEFLAENLMPDSIYYINLRAVENDTTKSDWTTDYFKAGYFEYKGDGCILNIHMTDLGYDGWRGPSLYINNNGNSKNITLSSEDVISDDDSFTTDGGYVEIRWQAGPDQEEIGFCITNDAGDTLYAISAPYAKDLTNNQLLYAGQPCATDGKCHPQIDEITWSVDETATQYTINWTALNAKTYDIVVTQDANITEEQLEQQAISRKVRAYSFESERPLAFYNVYVRGICKDGKKGEWKKQTIHCLNANNPFADENELLEYLLPIELDCHKTGTLLEDALAISKRVILGYVFDVPDTTLLSIRFSYNEIPPYNQIICLRVVNDSIKESVLGGMSQCSDTVPSGKYALFIMTESKELGSYNLDVTLGKEAVDSLVYTEIALDYTESGDFTNCQSLSVPVVMGMMMPAHAYSFTPADTVKATLFLEVSSQMGGLFIQQAGHPTSSMISIHAGTPYTDTFIKDTTYYIYAVGFPIMGGQLTDTYTFTAKAYKADTIKFLPISNDTIIESKLTADDYHANLNNAFAHCYEFVLTKQTSMYIAVEDLSELTTIGSIQSDIPTSAILYKDSLTGTKLDSIASEYPLINSAEYGADDDTIHYFIVVKGALGKEYRLHVRSEVDYDSLGGKLIQVGERYSSTFDDQDKFFGYTWSGVCESVRVQLEKDKNYAVILNTGYSNHISTSLAVMQPGVKNGSYSANLLKEEVGYNDGWTAFRFTPDTTAEFSFLMTAYLDDSLHFHSVPFTFAVEEYITLEELFAKVDTVTSPYTEQDSLLNTGLTVLYDTKHSFHHSHSSYEAFNVGVYNVVAHAIEVPAGDTLHAELSMDGNNYDVVLFGYVQLNDTTWEEFFEDGDGAKCEHIEIVNDSAFARTYIVIGSSYRIKDIDNHTYELRIGLGDSFMVPDTVTARPSANSITVMKDAPFATIQEKLLAISMEIYDSKGSLVTTIPTEQTWWTIDNENNQATYELSNLELPLGYTFKENIEKVTVSIRRQQPTTVTARPSESTITVYNDDQLPAIKAKLADIKIKAYDSKDKLIATINTKVDSWSIDEENNVATYVVTNSDLPKNYAFQGGRAEVTVTIARKYHEGFESIETSDVKATKVIRDGQIYIIRDGKVYTIMGQLVR